MSFENVIEVILNPETKIERIGKSNYGWIKGVNGMNLRVSLDKKRINLDDVVRGLKFYLTSCSSAMGTYFTTIYEKSGILDDCDECVEIVKGEGTGDYKGRYVLVFDLISVAHHIGKKSGWFWSHMKKDWKRYCGIGCVYLIQLKQYQGTNVWKIGKTDALHLQVRCVKYNNDQKKASVENPYVIIVCLCYVSNTSSAEKALIEAFSNNGHLINGDNELFELDLDWIDPVMLFKDCLKIKFKHYEDDMFEEYDYGEYTYPENAYVE